MPNRSFRDLQVWQKAIELSLAVYALTAVFPRNELFGLTSQLRRASVSIPSNIAEGADRGTTGEFRQFLGIAKAPTLNSKLSYSSPATYTSATQSNWTAASLSQLR